MEHYYYVIRRLHQQKAQRLEQQAHIHRLFKNHNRSNARIGTTTLPWLVQIPLAAFFLMAGISKLTGATDIVALFDGVAVGQWLRYVTGGAEALGAILLVVPGATVLGAVLLGLVMIGAVGAELLIGGNPALPFTLLLVCAAIAGARRAYAVELHSGWTGRS